MSRIETSEVLTLRVPRDLARRLAREAKRQRRTRGAVARDLLEAGLDAGTHDPAAEARRQSLLACSRDSEQEALHFIVDTVDLRGWR
jgi:hypothetical protein